MFNLIPFSLSKVGDDGELKTIKMMVGSEAFVSDYDLVGVK